MKVSFQKITYPTKRHPKMKHKSKRYFPECFVYNAVLCQRGKNLWSLSICQSIAFFLPHFLLYFNRGGKNYLSRNKSRILNTALLYPFVSWFTFIKMWKLTGYWEVTGSSSLKEIIKFTRWHTPPSLVDFSLAWVRSNQWNTSTSLRKN